MKKPAKADEPEKHKLPKYVQQNSYIVILHSLKAFLQIGLSAACLLLVVPEISKAQDTDEKQKIRISGGVAGVLAFSGLNTNVTGEVRYGRHQVYLGPKISVADQYLPSKAPLGLVTGYKFFFLKNQEPGQFNFFANLDYQLQYHKAFRNSADLPKRYNVLHELNAGYGLQYNISRKFSVVNVLGFGRYLEVFNNPKTNSSLTFDGWNRMLKVQVLYHLN